jgi:NAD binding domain of 6-phosphogluconate dehydrogenase
MSAPTPTIGIIGCGVTGRRLARRLAVEGRSLVLFDTDRAAVTVLGEQLRAQVASGVNDLVGTAVVVCCQPGPQAPTASRLLASATPVATLADALDDVQELLDLDALAARAGVPLVVGAGMTPGLSGLLVRRAAHGLAQVDEVHVAAHGTGGPACAAQHHRALGDTALGWDDGQWIERPGGSGRELCWFPEPVGPRDCYRAAIADPVILPRVVPHASRVSARLSATRRDRLTARLPMLTPPHADGDRGALRVEVRGGLAGGARETVVIGAAGDVGDLAAAVAAAVAMRVVDERPEPGVVVLGSGAMSDELVLAEACRLGVRLQEFTGTTSA